MIAEIGAGAEPKVQHLMQFLSIQAFAAFVDEADNRNLLLAEWPQ